MKWNTNLYDQSHDFVSKYGQGILAYLNPQPGEVILDLGCGTGDLAKEIEQAGAKVIGIDSSEEMIEKAKAKYPGMEFSRMDAAAMKFDRTFDAIFSNAVLHWIPEKEKVISGMYEYLKENGRIVLEFGGKGNNEQMLAALRSVFIEKGYSENARINFWYYPSIGEYATEMEKKGFRVVHAEHFDRVTPLKGDQGIKDWFLMFGDNFFKGITAAIKEEILDEVQQRLKKTHLIDGKWYADYRRIRIIAIKERPTEMKIG